MKGPVAHLLENHTPCVKECFLIFHRGWMDFKRSSQIKLGFLDIWFKSVVLCFLNTGVVGFGIGMSVLPAMITGDFTSYLAAVKAWQYGPQLLFLTKFYVTWPFIYHMMNGIRHVVSLALNHAKLCFWPKSDFFYKNLKMLNKYVLHLLILDSGGQRHLEK